MATFKRRKICVTVVKILTPHTVVMGRNSVLKLVPTSLQLRVLGEGL